MSSRFLLLVSFIACALVQDAFALENRQVFGSPTRKKQEAPKQEMAVDEKTLAPTGGATTGDIDTEDETMLPTEQATVTPADDEDAEVDAATIPPTEEDETDDNESVMTDVPAPEEEVEVVDTVAPTEETEEAEESSETTSPSGVDATTSMGPPEEPDGEDDEITAPTDAVEPVSTDVPADEEVATSNPTEAATDTDESAAEASSTNLPEVDATTAPTEEETEVGGDEETTGGALSETEDPPLADAECSPESPCGICEGDCNSNDDCEDSLECFRRTGNNADPIPGCAGTGVPGQDYCYMAADNHLSIRDTQCTPGKPCAICEGDCDNDFDCEGDLSCFQTVRGEETTVPGCVGVATSGLDYCYSLTSEEKAGPTRFLRGA